MSFTSTIKNEISKLEFIDKEITSELSSILRTIANINYNIEITTENASLARRIYRLIKQKYQIHPKVAVRKGYNFHKKYIYMLQIQEKQNEIIEDLSLETSLPNKKMYADKDLTKAYLRGLFLGVGSINDPKKSQYHLEFLVDEETYATFVSSLLNRFHLHSKVLKRENKYMIYIKEAEKIADFLRIIKANNALFYYENIRIYRDQKNMTNRLNNCEQANVDKIIETALNQVRDIEIIEKRAGLELLDAKTKEAAIYRLKYPEVSLQELSKIITLETGHAISKSGLHHRFTKIKEFAQKLSQ